MTDYKKIASLKRQEAKKRMTQGQLDECASIINTAVSYCTSYSGIFAKAVLRIKYSKYENMILELAKVFEMKMSKETAHKLFLRAAAKHSSDKITSDILEVIGWKSAIYFSNKSDSILMAANDHKIIDHELQIIKDHLSDKIELTAAMVSAEPLVRAYNKTIIVKYDNSAIYRTYGSCSDYMELEENELWTGEIAACTIRVGDFLIRMSNRIYTDNDRAMFIREKNTPVAKEQLTKDQLEKIIEYYEGKCLFPPYEEFRTIYEVHAKYIDDTNHEDFKFICYATRSRHSIWYESINFITAIKLRDAQNDNKSILFVKHDWFGDSHSDETWYALRPDGCLKSFYISGWSPYSDPVNAKKWDVFT